MVSTRRTASSPKQNPSPSPNNVDQGIKQSPVLGVAINNFKEMVMKVAADRRKRPLTAAERTRIEEEIAARSHILSHTPNHPPYSFMIMRAIGELNEESGSNEESISDFIRKDYPDLPWAHSSYLKHHLHKLCEIKEIFITSETCYLLGQELNNPIPNQSASARCEMKQRRKTLRLCVSNETEAPDKAEGEKFPGGVGMVVRGENVEEVKQGQLSKKEQNDMGKVRGKTKKIEVQDQLKEKMCKVGHDIVVREEKKDAAVEEGKVCKIAQRHISRGRGKPTKIEVKDQSKEEKCTSGNEIAVKEDELEAVVGKISGTEQRYMGRTRGREIKHESRRGTTNQRFRKGQIPTRKVRGRSASQKQEAVSTSSLILNFVRTL